MRAFAEDLALSLRVAGVWGLLHSNLNGQSERGVGKVRLNVTKTLWVQGAVKQRRMTFRKIACAHHPGDVLTNSLATDNMREKFCPRISHICTGCDPRARAVVKDAQSIPAQRRKESSRPMWARDQDPFLGFSLAVCFLCGSRSRLFADRDLESASDRDLESGFGKNMEGSVPKTVNCA